MIKVRADLCPQNHPCPTVRVCPTGAIRQQGHAAPQIDDAKCTGCGKCVKSCFAFVGDGRPGR